MRTCCHLRVQAGVVNLLDRPGDQREAGREHSLEQDRGRRGLRLSKNHSKVQFMCLKLSMF